MKKLLATAFLAMFALSANVQAAKPAPAPAPAEEGEAVVYSVGMTGVTWNGCKTSVRAAFSKLAGVSSVEIAPGKKPGTQEVTVTSTSGELTKDQAVASLGAKAKRFVVVTWEKKEG